MGIKEWYWLIMGIMSFAGFALLFAEHSFVLVFALFLVLMFAFIGAIRLRDEQETIAGVILRVDAAAVVISSISGYWTRPERQAVCHVTMRFYIAALIIGGYVWFLGRFAEVRVQNPS
jgi:hypothetical protein